MANPDLNAMPSLTGSSDAAAPGTFHAHKPVPPIPAEIYKIIVGNLRRGDLKRARLTCRELHNGLTPFLFDTIYITNDYVDMEHTRRILQHFRSCITTIILSPVDHHYTRLAKAAYQSLVRCCFEPYQGPAQWQQLLDLGYETYCEELPVTSRMLGDYELEASLEECLATVPNTRKIMLTDRHRLQRLADTLLRKHWPVDYEACDDMQHAFSDFHSCLNSETFHYSARPWTGFVNPFFDSLPEAISDIRELAITGHFDCRFIEPSSIDLLIQAHRPHTNVLANLTRLRFAFGCNKDIHDEVLKNSNVAKALCQARNLECLLLEFPKYPISHAQCPSTTFQGVLGGCRFPRLKTFGFAEGGATEEDLISFFVKHTKIRTLILSDVYLRAGFWEGVAQTIKATNSLHFVRLFNPIGIFPTMDYPIMRSWRGYYRDINTFFRVVNAFFHDNGPNPFSSEQIERWNRDHIAKRESGLDYDHLSWCFAFNDIFGLPDYTSHGRQPY